MKNNQTLCIITAVLAVIVVVFATIFIFTGNQDEAGTPVATATPAANTNKAETTTETTAADTTEADYPDELRQFIEESHQNTDTDDDGVVQADELYAQLQADFNDSDVNNDGVIDLDDVYNENVVLPEGVDRIDDLNHHMPGYDLDEDSKIELTEYILRAMQIHEHMDANQDDSYSLEEAHEFHKNK
ncbi:hypothetical protein ACFL2M_02235 [Patescibacteria group bacterium]